MSNRHWLFNISDAESVRRRHLKTKKHTLLFYSLIIFVVLSVLQAIYYAIDSGTTLPGNGAGEFILRKMIGIGLLAVIYFYTSKWWATNPRIRQLLQFSKPGSTGTGNQQVH